MEQPASLEVFIIYEVTQPEGDEVTEAITKSLVLVTEMMPVLEEVSVDPIPTPAPQAEVIIVDIPVTDSRMVDVQTSLPVIQAEETVAESPSYDLQQVMKSGSGTEDINLTSLKSGRGGENIIGMGPAEGKHPFFSFLFFFFSFLIILFYLHRTPNSSQEG